MPSLVCQSRANSLIPTSPHFTLGRGLSALTKWLNYIIPRYRGQFNLPLSIKIPEGMVPTFFRSLIHRTLPFFYYRCPYYQLARLVYCFSRLIVLLPFGRSV